VVSESLAAVVANYIRPYMNPDRHSEFRTGDSYPIASLYLDSRDLRLCRESLEGHKNRFKLRIRRYTDDPDYPLFFEIKRRVDRVIIKSRARVLAHSVADLLMGSTPMPQDGSRENAALGQFLQYYALVGGRPILLVRYQRQACESRFQDSVRITFDRKIGFKVCSQPEVSLNGTGWRPWPTEGVVLEIKFTGRCPAWVVRMIQDLDLPAQSVSKYVRSVLAASAGGLLSAGIL